MISFETYQQTIIEGVLQLIMYIDKF